MSTTGTLNLAPLMGAIPRWPLKPSEIPFQFAAHCRYDLRRHRELSTAPVFMQYLWPGEERIRFFLSPDAKHFYRMGILQAHGIKRDLGYVKSGEFQIRAPGMPIAPLELSIANFEPIVFSPSESLTLCPPDIHEDTLGPGAQRQHGSALKSLVAGGAILYDLPVAYRIQYLDAIGPDEYLLVGGLDCAQFITPEDVTVFRGPPRQMAKLTVKDIESEYDSLTIKTNHGDVRLPGDSLFSLACAFSLARRTVQSFTIASGFESLIADKLKTTAIQMAAVAKTLGLKPDASERQFLEALGVDFGPFPTREAYETWNNG